MFQLIASGTTPKLRLYIQTLATLAPTTGIASGQAYFISAAGARVACTNTMVEVSSSDGTKGWYTVLVDALDALTAGLWTLSYQTPTTAAAVGSSSIVVNPPANTTQWNGTAVSTPATAGIPDVNVKKINNVTAVTPGASGGVAIVGSSTVNANPPALVR